jgi:hypothetical protein
LRRSRKLGPARIAGILDVLSFAPGELPSDHEALAIPVTVKHPPADQAHERFTLVDERGRQDRERQVLGWVEPEPRWAWLLRHRPPESTPEQHSLIEKQTRDARLDVRETCSPP